MTTRDEREGPGAGDPDLFLQHLTQGGELLSAGHTEEALGYLESALSMSPADEKAQNLLGLCCFKLGHLDRAAEIYEHLVRENPVDPTLRVNLGLVYLKANATQRAVREFETATELAPDHRKAHNYLGLALAQAAEYGRAREHFLLAGSEHMAEKMARALDGAGFEPVTTPAGGVAALDPSHLGSGSLMGATPAPEFVDAQGQPQWDAANSPMTGEGAQTAATAEGFDAGAEWGPNAGTEGAWDDQASWGEDAGAGTQGWPHPDEAAAWTHPEGAEGRVGSPTWSPNPDADEVTYGEAPEGGGWPQDAGAELQAYGEAPEDGWPQDAGAELQGYVEAPEGGWPQDAGAELQAYGEAPEGGWPQDADAGLQPYGEAPEGGWSPEAGSEEPPYGEAPEGGGGWEREAGSEQSYGDAPEGAPWPHDAGPELQPDGEGPADGQWPPDSGAGQQPHGDGPEGVWAEGADAEPGSSDAAADAGAWEGAGGAATPVGEEASERWPQDDGAELQPHAQQTDPQDGVWPQDVGPELQPPPHPGAADAELQAGTTAFGTPAPEEASAPGQASAGDSAPEATSALDDDLESEPSRAATRGGGPAITPAPPEKVASLRPARLEDSWGAQFGLEDEGEGASEPAEELVVELSASEVTEHDPEDDGAGFSDIAVEPAEAPASRQRDPLGKGTAAAAESAAESRQESRNERPAQDAPSTRDASEVPGSSKWEERPGARSSGSGWLVELARQLELRSGPSTEGFTELGDGVVDLQLRDGMRTRTHGYFALEGKVRLTPESRRIRGRATEQHFGAGGREMMRVQGSGHLLARVPGRQLLSLELGEEGLFLREDAVYAFEENVMFENGSLSDPDGNEALKLVHLRGTGRLLVELEGALRSVQIREGAPARVELSRIVGWFGELVPQAVAAVPGLSAHLELSGQGFVLIDAAHREATP